MHVLSFSTGGNAAGIAMHESDGTFAFQLYGEGTNYGFLNGNWASWDIKKALNGNMMLNNSDSNIVWHAGNDGPSSGLNADTVDDIQAASFLRSDAPDTFSGDLTSSGSARLLIKKADNNNSDHIIFYNGTTRIGEIGCHDTTWLRINQHTAKNIYTPRYIRADGGFFVDGASKGIDGSGNFVNGTIAGASDYGNLLRSDVCLLYTSPSPRDVEESRMPSSA